jgi:two-component system chemotaxis sensor kinase CheA
VSAPDPVAIFRVEAQELLEEIERWLLDLDTRPHDRDLVDAVFRGMHTLKGSGAMFGFDALAAFTHHCETAFDRVRKGEVPVTPVLVRVILSAKDHMRALAEGREASAAEGDRLLAELAEALGDGTPAPATIADAHAAPAAPPPASGRRTYRIAIRLPVDALVNGTRPLPLLDELRALGDCEIAADISRLPPLEALDPTELHLGWTVKLTTDQPKSAIEEVFLFVLDEMTLEIAEDGPIGAAPPTARADAAVAPSQAAALPAPSPTAQREAPAAPRETSDVQAPGKPAKVAESVRVPAERLDELMDRVGELVIAQSRLKQLAGASDDLNLRSVAEEIGRLAAELRDTMMLVRMVPVAQLFGRFRRLVHDLAVETGKRIELTTEGETTELDKTVIERLADPLVHLIRNSADHGIEPAEARLAAGKPEVGRLRLSARQAGAEVIITVGDDGKGIDRARVRARAEENGLIQPDTVLSDQELLQLIFQPGFSTAKEVTNLSGRGVGMDVVKRTIESLRGSVEIETTPGAGSSISLRIPLTLAIIDGLLVRVGRGRYVIPLAAVEECVELSTEQDLRSAGRCLLTLRDRLVPFLRLRETFATGTPPDAYQKVVVVATGQQRVGLVVDQILGEHQTVIKAMSSLHATVGSFSGATILGDGSVALILDTAHLAASAERQERPLRAAS